MNASMQTRLKGVTVTTAVALVLAAGIGVARSDKALTEKPVRIGMGSAALSVPSNVSVPIRLDAKALAELANELVPMSFAIPEQTVFHDESWTRNPLNGNRIVLWSVTVNGYGNVQRTSPITVTTDKNGLVVSTTVHASFTARKGSLRETANADARVSAKIVFDVNENWEPIVRVAPTYSWINRPVARLFNLFDLSLGTVAERGLNDQISKLQAELPALVNQKLPLKQIMATAWQQAHTTVRVAQAPEGWLSVDPVSAHLMAPSVEGNDLMLNIGLVANLALSTNEPAKPAAEALPALKKAPPVESGFKVGLPIHAEYGVLEKALKASLRNQPIKMATPAGEAEIAIQDVVIYPSAPRLAIGVKLDMDLPDRWLDTKGWVYLYAEPTFDAERKVLRLKNASFARSVDNSLVRVATAAFAEAIGDAIEKRANIDLSGPLDSAVAKANVFLSQDLPEKIRAKVAETQGPLGSLVTRTDVAARIDGVTAVVFAFESDQLTLMPVVKGSLAVRLQPAIKAENIKVATK